jgi:hypothetical protein
MFLFTVSDCLTPSRNTETLPEQEEVVTISGCEFIACIMGQHGSSMVPLGDASVTPEAIS